MKDKILISIVSLIFSFLYSCGNENYTANDYHNKGSEYFQNGKYKKALELYSKSIEMNEQKNPDTYRMRGFAYFKIGKYSEAIGDLTVALQINSEDYQASLLRGASYYCSKDIQNAITDLENGLKSEENINKTYLWAWAWLGIAYYDIDEFEKSIYAYTRCLKDDPYNSIARANRGRAYYYSGNYDKAKEDLEKVLKNDPENEEINKLLAIINFYPSKATILFNGVVSIRDGSILIDAEFYFSIDSDKAKKRGYKTYEQLVNELIKPAVDLALKRTGNQFSSDQLYYLEGTYRSPFKMWEIVGENISIKIDEIRQTRYAGVMIEKTVIKSMAVF
jgi:tetratricopeptide (TPR) repeat protein